MEDISYYKTLLDEIIKTLSIDPTNEELIEQKQNIEELLSLAKEIEEPIWKIGDGCQALWEEDNNYYNAVIVDTFIDGTCKVQFDRHNNKTICDLKSLRPKMDEEKLGNKIRQRKRQKNKEAYMEGRSKIKQAKMEVIQEVDAMCEAERKNWKKFKTKLKKKEKRLAPMKKEEKLTVK